MTAAERETGVRCDCDGAERASMDHTPNCALIVHRQKMRSSVADGAADPLADKTNDDWADLLARHRLGSHDFTTCDACFMRAGLVAMQGAAGRWQARAEAAEAAIAAARAVHYPRHVQTRSDTCRAERHAERPDCVDEYDECAGCSGGDRSVRWPCPTVAALETETP